MLVRSILVLARPRAYDVPAKTYTTKRPSSRSGRNIKCRSKEPRGARAAAGAPFFADLHSRNAQSTVSTQPAAATTTA
jgi:hypothetical protein